MYEDDEIIDILSDVIFDSLMYTIIDTHKTNDDISDLIQKATCQVLHRLDVVRNDDTQ